VVPSITVTVLPLLLATYTLFVTGFTATDWGLVPTLTVVVELVARRSPSRYRRYGWPRRSCSPSVVTHIKWSLARRQGGGGVGDPVTNKIYVANRNGDTVTVTTGPPTPPPQSTGNQPPIGGREPCHEQGIRGQQQRQYRDGDRRDTNAPTNVTVGTSPQSVAVNPVTNKIYVATFPPAT